MVGEDDAGQALLGHGFLEEREASGAKTCGCVSLGLPQRIFDFASTSYRAGNAKLRRELHDKARVFGARARAGFVIEVSDVKLQVGSACEQTQKRDTVGTA